MGQFQTGTLEPMPDDYMAPTPQDRIVSMPEDYMSPTSEGYKSPSPEDYMIPMPEDFMSPMPEPSAHSRFELSPFATSATGLKVDITPPTDRIQAKMSTPC